MYKRQGLVHVKLKVRNLLAGIITMTALFSVNLQIAGSNLTIDRGTDTIFTSAPVMALFGDLSLSGRKLIVSLALVIVIKLLLDAYFHTKSGLLLRAVGDNATLVTTLAKDRGTVKILGLVISNALVAFGGCIVCQMCIRDRARPTPWVLSSRSSTRPWTPPPRASRTP